MNVLIICTSCRDRSPALAQYFFEVYPENYYRAAGINEYFCNKRGTHILEQQDLDWADLIVYVEDIHYSVVSGKFKTGNTEHVILNCGEYKAETSLADDFIQRCHVKLAHHLHSSKNQPAF